VYDLDAVDRQIIRVLQQDGRTSNVDIARRVGVSEATVRKRLDRLAEAGVFRVTATPNPAKIGYSTVTFITLDVDLAQLDRIADELIQAPQVRSVYYTTGESDLLVEAWFRSSDGLLQFLTQHIAAIPGVKRTATWHVLRTIKDCSQWSLPPVSPPHILVVDDDSDFLAATRMVLAAEGFTVRTARNGEEALARLRVRTPDLVILDVMMRGLLDGLKMGEQMRTDSDLRAVPILMVSSITESGFAGLLPDVERLPVDNFLVKPVDPALLLAEVRRLVRPR
jgi:Lrp/AsnC family transcriptional regulator for asnA, asnC and gidA